MAWVIFDMFFCSLLGFRMIAQRTLDVICGRRYKKTKIWIWILKSEISNSARIFEFKLQFRIPNSYKFTNFTWKYIYLTHAMRRNKKSKNVFGIVTHTTRCRKKIEFVQLQKWNLFSCYTLSHGSYLKKYNLFFCYTLSPGYLYH